jgi:UDP-N-acetylglucosamine transferase subunit ALG13
MILVTVGTERFDELVRAVDELVARGQFAGEVLVQIGQGQYTPEHVAHVRYLRDMSVRIAQADLVITHAGTGSVCDCISSGRPFIAVVDQRKSGNHQLEFARALSERFDFCWIDSPTALAAALPQARPARPLSQFGVAELADDIRQAVSGRQRRMQLA